jgi:hypothetical protein
VSRDTFQLLDGNVVLDAEQQDNLGALGLATS